MPRTAPVLDSTRLQMKGEARTSPVLHGVVVPHIFVVDLELWVSSVMNINRDRSATHSHGGKLENEVVAVDDSVAALGSG